MNGATHKHAPRVFISSPMSANRPAFDTEAARLRSLAAEHEFAMLMLSIAVRLRVGCEVRP
jgi:hypothetical protein